MLEPIKLLDKLWNRIEKSKMPRKRKDFLETIIALAMMLYILSLPFLLLYLKEIPDFVKWIGKVLG